jgi:hypothetical protein
MAVAIRMRTWTAWFMVKLLQEEWRPDAAGYRRTVVFELPGAT